MKTYKNKSGDSGVAAYETGADFIKILFRKSPKIYTYTYQNPGEEPVERMKILAEKGSGLSIYISQNVKSNYEKVE